MTRTVRLAGTSLELVERGQGRPLLFLHAGEGLAPERPWLELLSRHYRVIAPWHPGYGGSPLIDGGAGGIDDLAYLYLDLATELGLEDAVLVGADLGGWIAAEMMVRSTARFSCLVLVAPLGIKLRGRDERDIADFHAMTRAEYLRAAWADPAKGEVDYTALAGQRAGGDRARPRSLRAIRLEAVHAQPAPEALAAPHRSCRPCCCGERRTASSPLLMARVGARKFPAPGST